MVRVVIDTSVLIAALRSGGGASAEVLRLALRYELTTLMDYKLAAEYREVALRTEQLRASGRSASDTRVLLDALEAVAEPVYVAFRHRPLSTDADDDRVLDIAINGGARAVVTMNTKHFRAAAKPFGVDTITPAQLLTRLVERR